MTQNKSDETHLLRDTTTQVFFFFFFNLLEISQIFPLKNAKEKRRWLIGANVCDRKSFWVLKREVTRSVLQHQSLYFILWKIISTQNNNFRQLQHIQLMSAGNKLVYCSLITWCKTCQQFTPRVIYRRQRLLSTLLHASVEFCWCLHSGGK